MMMKNSKIGSNPAFIILEVLKALASVLFTIIVLMVTLVAMLIYSIVRQFKRSLQHEPRTAEQCAGDIDMEDCFHSWMELFHIYPHAPG